MIYFKIFYFNFNRNSIHIYVTKLKPSKPSFPIEKWPGL